MKLYKIAKIIKQKKKKIPTSQKKTISEEKNAAKFGEDNFTNFFVFLL